MDKEENDKIPKISYIKFFSSCDTEHSFEKLASMRSRRCARCHERKAVFQFFDFKLLDEDFLNFG